MDGIDLTDISKKQNLFVLLMELRALEMHFEFSYIKSKKQKYLEGHDLTRKKRQKYMKLIGVSDEFEDWCSSKHIPLIVNLLIECAAKEKNKKLRKRYLDDAWFFYGMFWVLNSDAGKDKEKT